MTLRADLEVIASLVPAGSRVLDLGCGDGSLLAHLQASKGCSGYGVEIADGNLRQCVARGVNALQLNLEDGLALFDDKSFDVVLQLDTLQHLRNTERMLRETARVGRIGIVAFPNFAHGPNRLRVALGRMPVTKTLPYQWYDTPNIRVGTLASRLGQRRTTRPSCRPKRSVTRRPQRRASTSKSASVPTRMLGVSYHW
jgi:methionine biosynthesis protein MetW